jgi:hypothetical protein
VRRYTFHFNNKPDAPIIQIYSVKTLHVSGNSFAHHQEFSTVHSVLVSFMQVFDDRFQAESGWNFLHFHPGFYITHSDAPQSIGLLWSSGQLVAETTT